MPLPLVNFLSNVSQLMARRGITHQKYRPLTCAALTASFAILHDGCE